MRGEGFMFSFSKEMFWEIYQQGALVFYQRENLTQRISALGNSECYKIINRSKQETIFLRKICTDISWVLNETEGNKSTACTYLVFPR